ncbi:glucan biosynthesis protein D [Kaistia defluvii]|uniref:glucan biosynthesis protein n=1 Tax=Kaistia defluvii TaxID=410841 RepID=UPI00224DE390|nr:glucan biosynthesis protein D [Kaistia defluvii]MCX5516927.1 glucan biosynthesis protein D [Kaistia defluvii]
MLTFLSAFAAVSLSGAGHASAAASAEDAGLVLGPPEPFSFDRIKELAADKASRPFVVDRSPHGDILDKIDYDNFQSIVFRRDHALWADGKGGDPIQLFHLGKYFQEPASVHVVDDGQSREILYRRSAFDMPEGHPARALPDDIGFAGFRIEMPSQTSDWLAFLGASYFRSSGSQDQYGLSARGIAVNTAMPEPEEFPRFTGFWLERVLGQDGRVIVYCLLDGPSLTGAYRMDCTKDPVTKGVVMDIDCKLFPRRQIARLGVAPLTSMYWYSETMRRQAIDWRPEVHDSDGLGMWTGTGERIWRPLNNPPSVMTNSFQDKDPRGFGFLQRDRNFDHFQDDGVFYDRRPSVWVEPKGQWGKGAVQLVEIPTDREIDDNIVVYWVPTEPVLAGRPLDFGYKLYWDSDEPNPTDLGRVQSTYHGVGGIPGQPRPEGAVRFVVDFTGPKVADLKRGDGKADITVSRGNVTLSDAYPVVAGEKGVYRVFFDLMAHGSEPIDMRMFVRDKDGAALTETWLYQFFPANGHGDKA